MYMAANGFEYHRPASIQEAIKLLEKYGEAARVIAGGTSLILVMREKLIQPAHLVSIAELRGLDSISLDDNGDLRIGASATHRSIEKNLNVRERFSVLAEMEADLGSVQLRNRGTIGGSLCHAEPLSDPPTVLVALKGEVMLRGSDGDRQVPVEQFIKGYYETDMRPNEILTQVRVPKLPLHTGCSYFKLVGRKAMDKPFVGVCVVITLGKDKQVCEDIRIALGAVSDKPERAKGAEEFLLGKRVIEIFDGASIEAGRLAMLDVEPFSEVRCSGEYKKRMVGVMVNRTIRKTIERAKES